MSVFNNIQLSAIAVATAVIVAVVITAFAIIVITSACKTSAAAAEENYDNKYYNPGRVISAENTVIVIATHKNPPISNNSRNRCIHIF